VKQYADNKNELPDCDCCPNKARFNVGENNVCGRHLITIIEMKAPVAGGSVSVEVLTNSI